MARVHSVEDVQRVKAELYANTKIARATHNIAAYRIHVARSGAFLQVCHL